MEGIQRYFVFGIGALLGCLILGISYYGKYNSIQKRNAEDVEKGFFADERVLPGQDLTARKPFHTGPALFTKDYPINENSAFKRVIIATGPTKEDSLWRIEETVWRDPETGRERLVRRQKMHADRVVVRLKTGSISKDNLSHSLEPFNMKVISQGRSPQLYNVLLPSHDIESVPNAIAVLNSKVSLIDAAVPSLILDF